MATLTGADPASMDIPRWTAWFGLAVWVSAVLWLQPLWAVALLLFAPLVLVPLGLDCVSVSYSERLSPSLWRLLRIAQCPAALLLIPAFALEQGGPAALLAVPWMGVTLLAAAAGALMLIRTPRLPLEQWSVPFGLMFLSVGGIWTVISRAGWQPLGIDPLIVLATAVHFHFAGFALPLIAGWTGGLLRNHAARLASAGVLLGVPFVAVGITLSAFGHRAPELAAVVLLTAAGVLVALGELRLAARTFRWPTRLLLVVSGLSLLAGLALAIAYALGVFRQTGWPDIWFMIRFHGTANAFGFSLAGLLAWRIAMIGSEQRLDVWESRAFPPGIENGPDARCWQDAYERVVAIEPPGPPEEDGPFRRVAEAIFRYDIFPPGLITGVLRRVPVRNGDTVGALYRPFPGVRVFFAARVIDQFGELADEVWRCGFTYRTLAGHPEFGEETFSVEKDAVTGRVTASLRSWSRPARWWVRLVGPLARRLQVAAGFAALDHLAHVAAHGASREARRAVG